MEASLVALKGRDWSSMLKGGALHQILALAEIRIPEKTALMRTAASSQTDISYIDVVDLVVNHRINPSSPSITKNYCNLYTMAQSHPVVARALAGKALPPPAGWTSTTCRRLVQANVVVLSRSTTSATQNSNR